MSEEADAAGPLRLDSAQGRWVLTAAVLGSGVVLLDSTVVNVALPALGRDLDADFADLQWTVNGYLLSLAALICSAARSATASGGGGCSSSARCGSARPACCAASPPTYGRSPPRGSCRASAGRC